MTRTLNIIEALSDFGDLPDDVFEYLYDNFRDRLNVTWTDDLTPMQVATEQARNTIKLFPPGMCNKDITGKIYRAIQTSAQCWEDNNIEDVLTVRRFRSEDHTADAEDN